MVNPRSRLGSVRLASLGACLGRPALALAIGLAATVTAGAGVASLSVADARVAEGNAGTTVEPTKP